MFLYTLIIDEEYIMNYVLKLSDVRSILLIFLLYMVESVVNKLSIPYFQTSFLLLR